MAEDVTTVAARSIPNWMLKAVPSGYTSTSLPVKSVSFPLQKSSAEPFGKIQVGVRSNKSGVYADSCG